MVTARQIKLRAGATLLLRLFPIHAADFFVLFVTKSTCLAGYIKGAGRCQVPPISSQLTYFFKPKSTFQRIHSRQRKELTMYLSDESASTAAADMRLSPADMYPYAFKPVMVTRQRWSELTDRIPPTCRRCQLRVILPTSPFPAHSLRRQGRCTHFLLLLVSASC